MHLQFIANASNQSEAKILAAIASFSADAIDVTTTAAPVNKPLPEKTVSPAAKAEEPAPKKSPGRPKKVVEPEPVVEDTEDTDDEILGDSDDDEELELETADDENEESEDAEIEETPVAKKPGKATAAAKTSAPKEPVYKQKDLIDAFKNFVTVKGRDTGVALLKKYNVKSMREIKEADYPVLMKLLTK